MSADLSLGERFRTNHDRVAGLLTRYPDVSGHEAREIMTFLQTGRYSDVGRLTQNSCLQGRLDQFVKDHRHQFSTEPGWTEALAALIFPVLFILWIILAAGSRP